MSEYGQAFINHLAALAKRNRGALATLRRSLTFAPGADPRSYPFVERFVGKEQHSEDPRRIALYLVAGLFAFHPEHHPATSFASAFGRLARTRESASIEQRYIALLGAEPGSLPQMLRQAMSLLAADGYGVDYVRLLDDLATWLNPFGHEARDRLRQRWARDFYRSYDTGIGVADETAGSETTNTDNPV